MSGLLAIMAGEWRQIAGNRPAFAAMIVAIAVYAVYYPQPYLEEALRDIPVAVVDLDQSSTSRLLIRRMDATDTVAIAVRVPDMAAAREAFFSRKVYGVAVIPAGFERKLLRGGASPVALFGDASYFLMYRQVTTGVVTTALSVGANVEFLRLITGGTDPSLAQAAVDPLPLNSVALFNPQGGYATNVLPAALVLILQQTLLMGIGLLATSRERLPLTARCDAPLRVAGKALAYTALYYLHLLFYTVLVPRFYGIPRLGHLADTLLFALPFLLSASLLGLTISSLFRRPQGVQLVLAALGMPLFMLSGFSWPEQAIPPFLNTLSSFIPSSAAIDGLVRINQMGATLADVDRRWATLWGLTALYGALALVAEVRSSPRSDRKPGPV